MSVTSVFLVITALFGTSLGLRSWPGLRVCALCAAVSGTWLILLVLFYAGAAVDPVLLGILMGGSVVGGLYWFQQTLPRAASLFTLPFFLTGVLGVYGILKADSSQYTLMLLAVLWSLFLVIYVWQKVPGLRTASEKIIECCKNW